ncbi:hypothetical protein AL036_15415 [Salipiger aestuarii]|uniref:DUF6455 domain-containing protein n=1 Tax=Salipiger aestuarii TaxID=568098 RepID=A0A327XWD9_9RHOB|nr:DUF6455 family protein [Salipiger aestuarii]EIE52823.1 hypothetical protein C357_01780 [Citreicella sp. 357]KAA8606205.1 hypothetical protein AL036_15415 [Salipiger aestuarii]KAB2540867.1 hypothetical protein AL035_15245 [Salipiger aestuarii]RAK12427.1 hypothetical protein ATI53_104236 [Salipiger aestuarii]
MAHDLRDSARHFWMTRSVARVMGLNLSNEMRRGRLEPDGYARMVASCQGCALVEACQSWLGDQTDVSAAPPPGCRIGAQLGRLKRLH